MLWTALLIGVSAHAGPRTVAVGAAPSAWPVVEAALPPAARSSLRCYRVAGFCLAELPAPPSPDQLRLLATLPGVDWAEGDRRIPGDPLQSGPVSDAHGTEDCPDLWGLDDIGMDVAWTLADAEAAPVVAVQDAGFLLTHEDLQGTVSGQFDYGDLDTVPEVEWDVGVPAHGTFIAGLIAARGDNESGRVGVIPGGLLNLQKVADSSGALYYSYAAAAMADLADGDLGVGVLSYSIASSGTTSAFDAAIAALGSTDILLVAAAGNCGYADCWDADNDVYPLYPANSPGDHILSVAGTLRDGGLNSWSHYGASTVDLAAPGVELCSLGVSSDTATFTSSGTSYATPLVAGVAALVRGTFPSLTAVETARVIRASALDDGQLDGLVRAGGRLSAERALQTAVPRLEAPADVAMEDQGVLALPLRNVGADGEATVVLTHPAELVVVVDEEGWAAVPFAPGDALDLPDAGAHVATGHGTVLTGALSAGHATDLFVELQASAAFSGTATVRLALASDGADYLNAPYNVGDSDETGFLAYDFAVSATRAYVPTEEPEPVDSGTPADSGTPSGDDGDGAGDSAVPEDGPDEGNTVEAGDGAKGSGGCAAAPVLPGLVWLGGLLAVARRRRAGR
jgi:hypothetical protein